MKYNANELYYVDKNDRIILLTNNRKLASNYVIDFYDNWCGVDYIIKGDDVRAIHHKDNKKMLDKIEKLTGQKIRR